MRIMCLILSTWKVQLDKMAKLEARSRCRHAVLRLSRPRVSERNKSLGADAQVVSCHSYVVFHPFVEQLTVFYISGLVLASSSILQVLDLTSITMAS